MRSDLFLKLCTSITCLTLSGAAHAFFPFVTDDTGTQGQGGNQFEIGYDFSRERATSADDDGFALDTMTRHSRTFPVSYTFGATDTLDLFVGGARQTGPYAGWENTQVGAKWVFAGDQTQGWSFALKPSVILPVSQRSQDNGLGSAQTNWGLTLISSYVSDDYEVHVNAGYAGNRFSVSDHEDAPRRHLWNLSVAPVWVINDQWKLGVNLGVETNPDYTGRYSAFGELGLSFAPVKNLQVGLGVILSPGWNKSDNARSTVVTTGLTYQF